MVLLTYLEDLVTIGPRLKREDDLELRTHLATSDDELEAVGSTSELAGRLRAAASADGDGAAGHEARRELLCEVIFEVRGRRRGKRRRVLSAASAAIAECRRRSLAREDAVWERAELLSTM